MTTATLLLQRCRHSIRITHLPSNRRNNNQIWRGTERFFSSTSTTTTTTSPPDDATFASNDVKKKKNSKEITPMAAFAELSKLKLSTLVVSTTSAGFLAAGGPISFPTLAACTLGTALCSSSAATFNQVYEKDRDAQMKRTRNRPLPRQIYTPTQAVALGCTTGLSGTALLYAGIPADPTTALLGLGNIGLYAGLYTYMKPRSEWNTWVGALVGAIPPVMGWTAAGGSMWDIEAVLLGGTLFLWQFPHFFALSWMHRVDYGRGGFQMVPVNDPHGDRTSDLITRYTYYLSTLPFVSTYLGVTSSMFAIEGLALNGYALYVAHKFQQDRSNQNARKVFLTSLWYLPSFLTLFILHSKTWKEEEDDKVKEGDVRRLLKEKIQYIRGKGKELCVHEVLHHHDDNNNHSSSADGTRNETSSSKLECPIAFGKKQVDLARKTTGVLMGSATTTATVAAVSSSSAAASSKDSL